MIIATFATGKGKSRGPLNYLFAKDKDGKIRDPAPELVKGDRKLTSILIDTNNRKYKYTSGAIGFRDNENPTKEQIQKIIEAFERTFTPGLQERVPILWVKHQDKGNVELHFIVPTQDALTGKQFNICPPGQNFQQMYRDFQALANDANKWDQVRPSLFKSEMSKVEALADDDKNIKKIISKELEKKITSGQLKNRNDLLNHFKKNGFEITRTGKDYISLKYKKAKKATRFKGPVFSENSNYAELLKLFSKPPELTEIERTEIKTRLARAVKNRRRSLKEHLDNEHKETVEELVDDSGGTSGGSSGGDITISINTEQIKQAQKEQQQATPDLPYFSNKLKK